MKTAFGFSILVFAPLFIAFLLPTLFLLPTSILVALISIFDPTIAMSESVGYNAWVCIPILASVSLLLAGMCFHTFHLRGHSHKKVWIAIWVVFSVALFVSVWFGITILMSMGASDYSAILLLQLTAKVAAFLTFAFQPGVVLWLCVSSRFLHGFESAAILSLNSPGQP